MSTAASPVPASPTLDVDSVRRQFPCLKTTVHGKPLVYLDSAASAQKPQAVIDAERDVYEHYYSNIHRGVHTLSVRATDAYEKSRVRVQRLLGAPEGREIVLLRGATEAINLVAQTWGRRNVGEGEEILITGLEHHSNIVPWQMLCAEKGANLRVAPIDDAGVVDLAEFERLLGQRTRLVSVSHISNALGTVNPVREMTELAHAAGAVVMIDGAQAVPHTRVDVKEIGCDFYAFSGHKVYGPSGVGALYGRAALLEAMPPWQGGGDMIATVTFEKSSWAEIPSKFEAGTPNIAGVIALGAALDWVEGVGLEAIAAHEDELLRYGTELLSAIPGLRLIGTAPRKAGVLSFVLDGIHPHDIGTILDYEGVAVRTGHHCAQPVMDRYGVPATARASLACFNTRGDLDVLAQGIRKAQEMFQWNELRELYQEVILDHSRKPHHFREMPEASHHADGHNPLCGDRVTVYLRLAGDVIEDVTFQGAGCSISTASASMMTDALRGKTVAEARDLFDRFHDLVTSDRRDADHRADPSLGKLAVFSGVSEFPIRVKCASLSWHTMKAALEGRAGTSTE